MEETTDGFGCREHFFHSINEAGLEVGHESLWIEFIVTCFDQFLLQNKIKNN